MEFKWSTPTRRTDSGQELPTIPNEIYIAILESFIPPDRFPDLSELRTLRSFALACRFFCHIALPRIFERVLFDGSGDPATAGFDSAEWARAVITDERPALTTAAFVKHVVFQNWTSASLGTHIPMRGWLSHLVGFHCKALARMPNVESVVFSNADITADHVKALRVLPQLRVLEFKGRNTWDTHGLEDAAGESENAGVDPRAEGGFGRCIERIVIDHERKEKNAADDQSGSVAPDWACKAIAACPRLRSVVLDSIDMLVKLGKCLDAEAGAQGETSAANADTDSDASLATHKIREIQLSLPFYYRGSEENYVGDVFGSGGAWAPYFLSLEKLRIVVPPEYARQVFFKHGAQKIVESINKRASARLLKLVRLDIFTPGYTSPVERKLDGETLTFLAQDICPRLERFYFGVFTWTITRVGRK